MYVFKCIRLTSKDSYIVVCTQTKATSQYILLRILQHSKISYISGAQEDSTDGDFFVDEPAPDTLDQTCQTGENLRIFMSWR